ncbi:DUF4336 domain-containing protein [uncultured Jannaschia sp.]|uniref:DUF4336 domain-containing protein n=1 Tax=uncultured Jannaschia sp. TaxID=293347 RepID=UPI0026054F73|nr:DUF4336 domain-containing protein [uncultured Jannaschia sp.]
MTGLLPFGPSLWLADGATATVAGFRYPTRMVVIRLASGGSVLWSPVAARDALVAEVAALGPVEEIVAPNHLHHLWISDWAGRFPEARALAAPGLAAKRPDLALDGLLSAPWPDSWAGTLDAVTVPGNRITTEIVAFHAPSGTVLFTDLIQQLPPEANTGWRGAVARLDRMTGPRPQVPLKFRLAQTDRRAGRAAVRRILDWPIRQAVFAHGPPVTADAHGVVAEAFDWLGVA